MDTRKKAITFSLSSILAGKRQTPFSIYLTGALLTGTLFYVLVCSHCMGTNKRSYFTSLALNAAIWPLSVVKVLCTGTPFIVKINKKKKN